MIHHVSLGTNDVARSRAFYDPVMQVLGLRVLSADGRSADYGVGSFLFSLETPVDGHKASPGNGVHIAFAAGRREMVDDFIVSRWPMAARMQALPASGRNMTRIITAPSFAIPTATRSRR